MAGTVDSCQMLIKAKERKTLVSPAEGVASQEMAGLARCPTNRLLAASATAAAATTTTITGGGVPGESVCQDFYPAGVTTALQPTGCPSL